MRVGGSPMTKRKCWPPHGGGGSIEAALRRLAARVEGIQMTVEQVKGFVAQLDDTADTIAAEVAELQARIADGPGPVSQADFDSIGNSLVDLQNKLAAIREAAKPRQ